MRLSYQLRHHKGSQYESTGYEAEQLLSQKPGVMDHTMLDHLFMVNGTYPVGPDRYQRCTAPGLGRLCPERRCPPAPHTGGGLERRFQPPWY